MSNVKPVKVNQNSKKSKNKKNRKNNVEPVPVDPKNLRKKHNHLSEKEKKQVAIHVYIIHHEDGYPLMLSCEMVARRYNITPATARNHFKRYESAIRKNKIQRVVTL